MTSKPNSIAADETPRPCDIGLPAHLDSYRPGQWEAIHQVIYSPERFQAICLPTGSGKSLVPMSVHAITGQRVITATSTKGLQDQYIGEFGESSLVRIKNKLLGRKMSASGGLPAPVASPHLVQIRGKDNYECLSRPGISCQDGHRVGCSLTPSTFCAYYNQMGIIHRSSNVITNYAMWLNSNKTGRGLDVRIGVKNPALVLVLDEAHNAPTELANFLAVQINEKECIDLIGCPPPYTEEIPEWLEWAKCWGEWIKLELESRTNSLINKPTMEQDRELPFLRRLEHLGKRLSSITERVKDTEEWTCEEKSGPKGGRYWHFDPVWPGLYAEKSLFCGISKVILMSATIRPKTMGLLGVKESAYRYTEWPRQFPKYRSPIYHYPTIALSRRTTDYELQIWVAQIDKIIESRSVIGRRKGIIHTVSYARQQYLFTHSSHKDWFVGNTSDPNSPTAAEAVERFRNARPGAILVSPSFSTGWDFPGEQCEWQIISKIPFPDSQSKVMKARAKRDSQFLNYLAMQEMVQQCGRGTRSAEDRCETFIVDDHISWFLRQSKGQAPSWFEVKRLGDQLPPLPPRVDS